MKIAVIDDRTEEITFLTEYLDQYLGERSTSYQMVCFTSGEAFLDHFREGMYAVIFLDAVLDSENMNGMETAKKIREKDPDVMIIFSTNSPDFAIEGYTVGASGYLLKPYSYDQFMQTMDLVYDKIHPVRKYIEVKEKKMMVRVLLDDIIYCDYENHYIRIHTERRMVRSYMQFRELSKLLIGYAQFQCCYRNIIINMDQVREMEHADFLMSNGERIPMRRQERLEIRQKYADYIFEKTNL